MNTFFDKIRKRNRRHARVRARISGTVDRPRLAVYKSNKYVYAQLIDDEGQATIAEASAMSDKALAKKSLMEQAEAVGKSIADKAKAKGIEKVVFDRGGFLYAGVVQKVADSAREGGLTF